MVAFFEAGNFELLEDVHKNYITQHDELIAKGMLNATEVCAGISQSLSKLRELLGQAKDHKPGHWGFDSVEDREKQVWAMETYNVLVGFLQLELLDARRVAHIILSLLI